MGKRTLIIISALLLLALIAMGYFLSKGKKIFFTDPYKAVSEKACITIETVDLQSFLNSLTTGKGLFGEIGRIDDFGNFNRKLKYIADYMNKTEYRELMTDGEAVISFYPDEDGKLRSLLSVAIPQEINFRQIKQTIIASGIKDVSETRINNKPVIIIPYSDIKIDTAFISLNSGLILLSSSVSLLREADHAIEKGSDVRDLPGFSRILLASGENEDKVFVVFENLPGLLKPLLTRDRMELAGSIARLAGSGGGDIYMNEDGLVLSGFTESTDSSDFLYRFKYLTPGEFQTNKILPAGTGLFETVVYDGRIIPVPSDNSSRPAFILASAIRNFIGDEITRVYIDIRENDVSQNNLIIYKLNDPFLAEQAFLEATGPNIDVMFFAPDDQFRIAVYKVPFTGLIKAFVPGFAGNSNDSLVAFYDNFMITGSSFKTIARLLYDNVLNNTLANDLAYRDFEGSLPSRSGYLLFCVPARIINYLEGILNDEIISSLRENRSSINKIQAAGYQLAASNNMIYNSISVRFKEEATEESSTEWETLLDTTAGIKPFFFVNHMTGEQEIFVQDLRNNVYLINAAGRVLWKVLLRERIEGSVYMIDYYRNGKLQLLFSGRNFLHLLDRNGNYVNRYPVRLRSPASNSLALFDYDNNGNYRIFIAGVDRLVYSYDKSGNVVKGWKPFRTAGLVEPRVSYFQVSGKDYLAVSDDKSLYLLDRYGNRRVTFRETVERAPGSALNLNEGSESFLVCTSNNGTIQQIYFDGTVKKINIRNFSSGHSFDIFDIDGDGFDEYIFIDSGILYLYDHNRAELFSRDLGSSRLEGPITFNFSTKDKKIGVLDADKNLIYLLDNKGEIMKGFPLRGASMFSIGRLSEKNSWHLIVGGPGRFLYNYKLQL